MKRICIMLIVLCMCLTGLAQTRHEARIGWGDMLFETAVFYPSQQKTDYSYTGHIFAGYQYSLKSWLSIGAEFDYGKVTWMENSSAVHFDNFSVIPEIRFTYFRKGIVTMYSGLGVGILINTGNEVDYLGRNTAAAPELEITAYGISVAYKNLFGAFEIGGLTSLKGKNEIYMIGSRLFSVAIGFRL